MREQEAVEQIRLRLLGNDVPQTAAELGARLQDAMARLSNRTQVSADQAFWNLTSLLADYRNALEYNTTTAAKADAAEKRVAHLETTVFELIRLGFFEE